jgi:hypothetical protein
MTDQPDDKDEQQSLLDQFCRMDEFFAHATPKCDHVFAGWREFENGNGGEQVCTKCGIGAMTASIREGL